MKEVRQALFNKSVLHILKQGRASVGLLPNLRVCQYRSADGCGCAAAPFINNYKPQMENRTWSFLVETFRDDLDDAAATHVDLVSALQDAHDGPATTNVTDKEFIRLFKHNAQSLAARQGLDLPAGFWD